ncbi:hypothetical protein F4801DRAFT_322373 [Xylaria longipes]|nr:hypothetical protein F4801DRAFT_322373 [Xylaria longipes]
MMMPVTINLSTILLLPRTTATITSTILVVPRRVARTVPSNNFIDLLFFLGSFHFSFFSFRL